MQTDRDQELFQLQMDQRILEYPRNFRRWTNTFLKEVKGKTPQPRFKLGSPSSFSLTITMTFVQQFHLIPSTTPPPPHHHYYYFTPLGVFYSNFSQELE